MAKCTKIPKGPHFEDTPVSQPRWDFHPSGWTPVGFSPTGLDPGGIFSHRGIPGENLSLMPGQY